VIKTDPEVHQQRDRGEREHRKVVGLLDRGACDALQLLKPLVDPVPSELPRVRLGLIAIEVDDGVAT
jgi:hypothetical protein